MVNVWAHCQAGRNSDLPTVRESENGEWSYARNFNTMEGLTRWLNARNLRGSIDTLVINCHGDFFGHIFLDVALTYESADRLFEERFRDLRHYLRPLGHLWFTGCSMAERDHGTQLMNKISRQLPGRVVIAFDRGTNNAGGSQYAAGNIRIQDIIAIRSPEDSAAMNQRVHVMHPAAKWVRDEIVLRYPRDEQRNRANQRCAYPNCRGHRLPTHQCDGGWNPGCQWRVAKHTRRISPYTETVQRDRSPSADHAPRLRDSGRRQVVAE